MSDEIETVLVAGYGLMGRGIALSFARGGHRTVDLSRNPSKATASEKFDSILAIVQEP